MPTLAIGNSCNRRGFTLVEILVVLAVLGLMVALVPVAYGKLQETLQYQGTVRQLTTEIRRARSLAMQTGEPQSLVIDHGQRHVQLNDRKPISIPPSLRVEADFARIEQRSGGQGGIRFYPDGSATGGSISLQRPSGEGVRLRVDWLLGRVTQEPLG